MPSKESCRRRRARINFEIAYFPPLEPTRGNFAPAAARASTGAKGPYSAGRDCVETSQAGTVLPPPDAPENSWEVHLLEGVSHKTGQQLQQSLVEHKVGERLHLGLGSYPPNWTSRTPIFVTAGKFDGPGSDGVEAPKCGDLAGDAIVVRADLPELASTTAHELFHAHSTGLASGTAWWEEASATWAEGKLGFPEVKRYDRGLQFPDYALDTVEPAEHQYAMSRFVQFLDLRGLLEGQLGAWPLQQRVIRGYPLATRTLQGELAGAGTSVGEQLAAFWGDRLRDSPVVASSASLKPRPPFNATRVEVRPGAEMKTISALPLHTRLTDFELGSRVKRVEFEFELPGEGYFWGATAADETRRFFDGESIAFCVGGAYGDALKWPNHFPVTFTNGVLDSGGQVTGAITIYAQVTAEHCRDPDYNRACRALAEAGVSGVLGSPLYSGQTGFGGSSGVEEGRPYVHCVYTGRGGVAALQITRWKSARDLRRSIRESCKSVGCEPLDLGDVAVIADYGGHAAIGVGVGHDGVGLVVTKQTGARAGVIELGRGVVHELG